MPEFRGYAAPSIGVLLGVFVAGCTALFCAIAGISIAREYAKESAAARRRDALRAATTGGLRAAEPSGDGNNDGYLTLAGDTDDEESDSLMGGSINASTEEEGRAVPKGKRDYGRGGGPRRMGRASGSSARRRRRRRAAAAAAAAQLGPSPLARKVSFYTRLLCGTGLAVTLVMCGVVVAFAPHAPGVNVCNTEFDWVSDGAGPGAYCLFCATCFVAFVLTLVCRSVSRERIINSPFADFFVFVADLCMCHSSAFPLESSFCRSRQDVV